jgi:hypothetical protein
LSPPQAARRRVQTVAAIAVAVRRWRVGLVMGRCLAGKNGLRRFYGVDMTRI